MDQAVYPCIDFAVENVNEFFFLLLRMGPRAALSGDNRTRLTPIFRRPAAAPMCLVCPVFSSLLG